MHTTTTPTPQRRRFRRLATASLVVAATIGGAACASDDDTDNELDVPTTIMDGSESETDMGGTVGGGDTTDSLPGPSGSVSE
jgi:hypothetical protein